VSALDELRFGPQRTLNLRETLPTGDMAARRAETWLREHQIKGSKEVLIITGRGNQSVGGVPVIRGAVERLLFSLRRRGIVNGHAEHNPGAFVVQLAPIRSLADAPARRREPARATAPAFALEGLSAGTTQLLRDLAARSLDALGVAQDDARLLDEMSRHLRVMVPGLATDEDVDSALRTALEAALAEYD
jgi:hypothetical protein